jgi:hypothetical protein
LRSAPYIAVISPGLLDFFGRFSPIVISNHTLLLVVPLVISRKPMGEHTERHEAIHVWQMLECGVVGVVLSLPFYFLLGPWAALLTLLAVAPYGCAYWPIYLGSYLYNLAQGMSGPEAYTEIIFEREAYAHDSDPEYIAGRPWFAWVRE